MEGSQDCIFCLHWKSYRSRLDDLGDDRVVPYNDTYQCRSGLVAPVALHEHWACISSNLYFRR